jgi:hypothetical protein
MTAVSQKKRANWKHALSLVLLLLLLQTGNEVYVNGFASGHWLGRFSAKWALTLAGYSLFATGLFVGAFAVLYSPARWSKMRRKLLSLRPKTNSLRWPLVAIAVSFSAYLVFWASWGTLFVSLSARILLFALATFVSAYLLTKSEGRLLSYRALLLTGVLLGTVFVLAESFVRVSDYPFSLHWSEGNRIYDYSLLYGRDRYNFPMDQKLIAFIDPGRQTLWGLPFLIPNVSLVVVRFWDAFLVTIPYAILGWMTFRPLKERRIQWALLGLWAMVFLNQGPIYTPLILSAILVSATRKRPFWLAVPLVFLAGHYAGLSRFTWAFAPAIWAAVLLLGDSVLLNGSLKIQDWLKALALGLAGTWTKGLGIFWGIVSGLLPVASTDSTAVISATGPSPTPAPSGKLNTLEGLQASATDQPFLWYRLLPNEAFPPGILIGLFLAALPLVLLLIHLTRRGIWKMDFWQQIATVAGSLAFLAVGVIASAKVGGGLDLHNLDMFFISLLFLAALTWEAGFHQKLADLTKTSNYLQWLLVLIVFIPAFQPLMNGKPLDVMSSQEAAIELERIQQRVACAAPHGDILLMDQRQLLSFGFLGDLLLVPEYEKKLVMNKALSSDAAYFEQFRMDLESGRYSMIISERVATSYKYLDDDRLGDSLVEENNAWVEWVTTPLLENYESIVNRRGPSIELFVPIERDFDC